MNHQQLEPEPVPTTNRVICGSERPFRTLFRQPQNSWCSRRARAGTQRCVGIEEKKNGLPQRRCRKSLSAPDLSRIGERLEENGYTSAGAYKTISSDAQLELVARAALCARHQHQARDTVAAWSRGDNGIQRQRARDAGEEEIEEDEEVYEYEESEDEEDEGKELGVKWREKRGTDGPTYHFYDLRLQKMPWEEAFAHVQEFVGEKGRIVHLAATGDDDMMNDDGSAPRTMTIRIYNIAEGPEQRAKRIEELGQALAELGIPKEGERDYRRLYLGLVVHMERVMVPAIEARDQAIKAWNQAVLEMAADMAVKDRELRRIGRTLTWLVDFKERVEREAAYEQYCKTWELLERRFANTHDKLPPSVIPWPVVTGRVGFIAFSDVKRFLEVPLVDGVFTKRRPERLEDDRRRWQPDNIHAMFGRGPDAFQRSLDIVGLVLSRI